MVCDGKTTGEDRHLKIRCAVIKMGIRIAGTLGEGGIGCPLVFDFPET